MGGFWSIFGPHFWSVPFQFFNRAHGDAAQENDFSEIGSDVEIGISGRPASAGGDPFEMVGKVALVRRIVFGHETIARNRLRELLDGRMVLAVAEFRVALQFEEEFGAVVIGGKDLALVADDEATAAGNFVEEIDHVGHDFLGRFVIAIVIGAGGLNAVAVAAVVHRKVTGANPSRAGN